MTFFKLHRRNAVFLFTMFSVLLVAGVANAQSTWTGGGFGGDWTDAGNWNPGTPGPNDTAIFDGSTPFNLPTTNSPSQLGGIVVTSNFGAGVPLDNPLTVTGNVSIESGSLVTGGQSLSVSGTISGAGT